MTLSIVAEHPDVVTPTGIDVDADGAVWVISCHTHFRPKDYDGPEHDEVIKLSADGERTVFYSRTDATMDLELGQDGWVYLAERDRVLRVRDTDGDGVGDEEQDIAVLETESTYPHNGLSGMTWHPSGDLVFALGENYWKHWNLKAPADGNEVTGTGEGGIFRCRPDGSKLRRIAKGFWNPFGVCSFENGTMFAAENDPGSRPPCRLLHIVEGGDYGYQRRYGNASVHPFVCLDGELPGTLPMTHSLAEAPCGLAPLGGGLLVGSWTDHQIDYYPLTANGASYTTERVNVVTGGNHFRPTCITQVSPTKYYLTDWVFGSYEIHQRGRVWKLEIDPVAAAPWLKTELPKETPNAQLARELRGDGSTYSFDQLLSHAESEDAFVARAALDALSERTSNLSEELIASRSVAEQISLLLAIRKADPKNENWAGFFLNSDSVDVRFQALRWISDEELKVFASEVDQRLTVAGDFRIFEACLATRNSLAGKANEGVTDSKMLIAQLRDLETDPAVAANILRLIDPSAKTLGGALLDRLCKSDHPELIQEVTRTLVARGDKGSVQRLIRIADNKSLPLQTRVDAISGISGLSTSGKTFLLQMASSYQREMREESLRSLRSAKLTDEQRSDLRKLGYRFSESADLIDAILDPVSIKQGRPANTNTRAWKERLAAVAGLADLEAGRRLFHHQSIGACWKCHRHGGRGNVVGPDLSRISAAQKKDHVLESVLQPSKDVDPQYYPRMLITDDGRSFTGILLRDGGGGKEFYRDANGRERMIKTAEVVSRKELRSSVMPAGLIDTMTDREIRDLLAFLNTDQSMTLVNTQSNNPFVGDWWLDFRDGYGGWIRFAQAEDGKPVAQLLWRVGSARSVVDVDVQGNVATFARKGKKAAKFEARIEGDGITVRMLKGDPVASDVASGKRCPPMPARPDLSDIKFGAAVSLFNGNDLTGWKLQPATAKNGWSAKNGELINETPKQDFSAYGTFGNLRTKDVFGDGRLHIEFNVGKQRNSGVYVRGLYEAQVVDRDSRMQGIAGVGAIFGRIEPSKNAGKVGGQWQTYDLTLVDRHITVVLNGEKVIDNQPVEGCTGGALFGDVTRDGPLYLQGDHTSVRYRNIRFEPRLK